MADSLAPRHEAIRAIKMLVRVALALPSSLPGCSCSRGREPPTDDERPAASEMGSNPGCSSERNRFRDAHVLMVIGFSVRFG